MTSGAIESSPLHQRALELYRAPAASLEAIMRAGTAPPFEDLAGWEFNGVNVGVLPGLLGIRKFRKGFYAGPARVPQGPAPFLQGYNIPVRQNGVGAPHLAKPSDEAPKRFGFYRVYSAAENPRFRHYPRALLLDYGLGGNGFTPEALLRDYLVQVHPGSSDLLLGHAYLALGPLAVPVSFFLLERARPHSFAG
jgi:hypothetical protein